jgi:hypothetical protein
MCKKSGESIDHLLLHCEIASALWNIIFSCVGLAWVMPRLVVDLFACWRGQFGSLHSATEWRMLPSCLMWHFWREINYRSFEDCERMVVELNAFSFNTLYHWTAAFDYFNISSFHDFLYFFSFLVVFLSYTSCVLGSCFALFNEFWLLMKKKDNSVFKAPFA